jgi:hypothetical protein
LPDRGGSLLRLGRRCRCLLRWWESKGRRCLRWGRVLDPVRRPMERVWLLSGGQCLWLGLWGW